MANLDAPDLNTRPLHTAMYGNAVVHSGTCTTVAATANGDVLRVMRIPAGTKISQMILQTEQVDSNGAPTVQAKIGYTPVDSTNGPAASDAYWAAAAARLRTKSAELLPAQPITFDYDVWAIVTLTAAIATLVVGAKVTLVAIGETVGTK